MKARKHKSKHKTVRAIIGNRLQTFKVLHEETWIPTDSDGDFAEERRYFVCGDKGENSPRLYLPVSTVLFNLQKEQRQ